MTTTWAEAKTKFEPHYWVSNNRDETTYSMPLTPDGDSGRIEVKFEFLNRDAKHRPKPAEKQKIDIEFSLGLYDGANNLLASAVLDKEDVLTLQKLLTSALEHSRVRRFQWLAEVQSESGAPRE